MPGAARAARHDCQMGEKSVFCLLAGLVGDAAAGLAGALAGGLALTAATVLEALGHVAGLEGLNVLHCNSHSFAQLWIILIVHTSRPVVKARPRCAQPLCGKLIHQKPAVNGFPPGFPQFQQKKPPSFPPFPQSFQQIQRG